MWGVFPKIRENGLITGLLWNFNPSNISSASSDFVIEILFGPMEFVVVEFGWFSTVDGRNPAPVDR